MFHTPNSKKGKWSEDTWNILLESNYDKVYRAAYSITLDAELAKEACQNAFISAFENIDTLKDRSKFCSWMCVIAMNAAKFLIKHELKQSYFVTSLSDDIINISDHNSIEEHFEEDETIRELNVLIKKLDINEQEILHLKYYEDLSYTEMAALLDIKEGTLRMNIFRIKEKLAKMFNKGLSIEVSEVTNEPRN